MVWELNAQRIQDLALVDTVGLQDRPAPLHQRNYARFLLKDEIWQFLHSSESSKITHIIHLGACSSTTEKNWDFLKENNLEYSQRLFSWCTEKQIPFIYASSAATYGDGQQGFDDREPLERLQPLNLYGKSKHLFDLWALEQAAQNNCPPRWFGLKFFNVYGPNEAHKNEMASVVFKAFHQIQKTGSMGLFKSYHPDYKDGEQKRDFVYVKDVTFWIRELMRDTTAKSGVYNMGFGEARTWIDLITAVFHALRKEVKINWLEMPVGLRDQYQYYTKAPMEKWKSAGLSKPKWSLEDGVTDYVKNHLLKGGGRE